MGLKKRPKTVIFPTHCFTLSLVCVDIFGRRSYPKPEVLIQRFQSCVGKGPNQRNTLHIVRRNIHKNRTVWYIATDFRACIFLLPTDSEVPEAEEDDFLNAGVEMCGLWRGGMGTGGRGKEGVPQTKNFRGQNRIRGWQPIILKIRNYSRVW